MRIDAKYPFNCDLDKTIDICINQTIGNVEFFKKNYENVADVKVLDLKEKDGKKYVTYEFCAYGQIPKAVQHILKPEMLTWREESYWDSAKKEYVFNITPHFFKNVFTCKGKWVYSSTGAGKSLQECRGELTIKIPIFGQIIEKAIWTNLKKGWDDSDKQMKKQHGIS